MLSKQLTQKLKEENEKDRDPQLQINANKYDRIMRSLSVRRENPNKRAATNIIQNFGETKLYVPPDVTASEGQPSSPKAEAIVDRLDDKQAPKVNKSNDAGQTDYVEVNINVLLTEIIDSLKDNSSTWFSTATNLSTLIPKALNYVDYNLKRNNNYIYEFETLLRASQQTQETETLKKELENQRSPAPSPTPVTPQPTIAAPVLDAKEIKKRSKSLKVFKSTTNTAQQVTDTPIVKPEINLTNGLSESNLTPRSSDSGQVNINLAANELSKLQVIGNLSNYLNDLRQQQAVHSNYRQLEQYIVEIGYCLNTLNRFWSKIGNKNQTDATFFDDYLSLFYENNGDNLSKFTQLENYLYHINWQMTNKNTNDCSDLDATSFSTDLNTILLTATTHANSLNINFLLSYYKSINYDFISFKLFIRQIQLIQIAAVLCQIIYRILNFYQKNLLRTHAGSQTAALNSKDYLVFPTNQYRPISWSNTHVTLHNQKGGNQLQPGQTQSLSTSQTSLNTQQAPLSPSALKPAPVFDEPSQQRASILNELFISDLKDFLNLSINRLNNQADVINNIGYFYIVNKATGLVLEAIEQPQTAADNNTKVAAKAKAARFYLTQKQKSRTEQLWYYYAYSGCVANKSVRSGHCMAVSSLNAKSPVCLFPNVRTTNCKWFFNHVDNTVTSGLGEHLVLDYEDELAVPASPSSSSTSTTSSTSMSTSKRYAVIINKKEPNKPSQKWTIEFQ